MRVDIPEMDEAAREPGARTLLAAMAAAEGGSRGTLHTALHTAAMESSFARVAHSGTSAVAAGLADLFSRRIREMLAQRIVADFL